MQNSVYSVISNLVDGWFTCTERYLKEDTLGTSLVVRWLRLYVLKAGSLGFIPGQGTRPHMPQIRVGMPQLKRAHVPQLRPGTAK